MKFWKLSLLGVCVGAALSLAPTAWAEGKMLGRIYVADAGTVSNVTSGYGSAGCSTSTGSCDQAFVVPTSSKITVQCDSAAVVSTSECGIDAGRGMRVTADQMFPTSTGASITCPRADGGTYTGGVVSIGPAAGSASARCWVWPRLGTE